jgi:hypothetical protein
MATSGEFCGSWLGGQGRVDLVGEDVIAYGLADWL